MSTLQKVEKGMLYADWKPTIRESSLEKVSYAGVAGNEREVFIVSYNMFILSYNVFIKSYAYKMFIWSYTVLL